MSYFRQVFLIFLPFTNAVAANNNLAPWFRLVGDTIVALLPIDQLDLDSLVWRSDLKI